MLTPAMQQYHDIKQEYSDAIIFFRMGDFYEMFGEDAHIAHKVLGINITSRNKNAKDPEALAGIPYHAKDKYLPQLVNAGYKVAIVEQVSDPKLKGIVKREVMRVVTPATLNLEGDNFDNFDQNTLLALSKIGDIYGMSLMDLASHEWKTNEFSSFEQLKKELFLLNPKEVILDKKLFQDESVKTILQKKYALNIYYYEFLEDPYVKLKNHFQTKNFCGFGLEDKKVALYTSALLLSYFEQNQKQQLKLFSSFGLYTTGDFLEIDPSTMKSLDILYNFSTGSEMLGTLYGVIGHTKTPMGKRFLKQSLLHPLKDKDKIQKRLDFVQAFYSDSILLDRVRQELSYISDLDAILNRLSLQRASPKDLLNLKRSLEALLSILKIIQESENKTLKKFLENQT